MQESPVLDETHRIPTVAEVMDRDVLTLPHDTDLLTAVQRMLHDRRPTAFVVDEGGSLLRMLTDAVCLRTLVPSSLESQSSEAGFDEAVLGTVAAAGAPVSATLTPDQDLFLASQRFLESEAAYLPVVDEARLVGGLGRLTLLDGIVRTVSRVAAGEHRTRAEAAVAAERPTSIERMQQMFAHLTRDQLVRLMGRHRQDP